MKETGNNTVVTGVTIQKDVFIAVKKQASKEKRSLSGMINLILAEKYGL